MAPKVPNGFLRQWSQRDSGEERTRLLEVNLISGQQLKNVVGSLRTMQTYAVTYVRPEKKLRTRIDRIGRENPTWNDKFIFGVTDDFLSDENSAVSVEIYAVGLVFDPLVGTVRALVSNLLSVGSGGAGFAALQIRRPSGRFHGVLNVGIMMIDGKIGSMTWRSDVAVGYRDLMGKSPARSESFRRNLSPLAEWNGWLMDDNCDGADGSRGKNLTDSDVCMKKKKKTEKKDSLVNDDGDDNSDNFEEGPTETTTPALCGLVFQKRYFVDPKIHLSPFDPKLQQRSLKMDG